MSTPCTLRILLIDPHALFRQGLAALLSARQDLQVIGQAADAEQALLALASASPDLVIIDPQMPGLNGIDLLTRALHRFPDTRFLCLCAHGERYRVNAALDAGAAGYLLKECGIDECLKAIDKIARGQVYLCAEVATTLALSQRSMANSGLRGPKAVLSQRELQVLQLLAEGLSTREIAERLFISAKTVSTHREHIMQKLKLKGIAQLTRYALSEGWLKH